MLTVSGLHAEFVKSEQGHLLREDTLCWGEWYKSHSFFRDHELQATPDGGDFLVRLLDKLFVVFPEFRSLVDYRIPKLRHYKSEQFKRATELHIQCPSIGPRFRIQHGHNTYVLAREIGSDFWVNHNVTIGSHRGTPKIGDRVTVRTGAIVVGPVTIEDDVLITANAVVSKSMPKGHVAYAPRTVFSPRRAGA